MKRLAMATLAKDMDRWIEKRDELSRKMEDIRKQKTALKREVSRSTYISTHTHFKHTDKMAKVV